MQLDENTPNSVASRPAAVAAGALVRWFQTKSPGVTGTTIERDYLNDILGCIRNMLAAASITRTKGSAGDSDLTDAVEFLAHANSAYPPGHIHGLTLSNDTDTDHDIEIEAGSARDQGNVANIDLSPAMTKLTDAVWDTGDNAGGFPSGLSLSADTWYHVFLIRNPTTGAVDAGYDTSLTASNLIADHSGSGGGDASGFTQYRRIGSVLTDGSQDIIVFHQNGNDFLWKDPPLDLDVTQGTSASTRTLSAPPDTVAFFNMYVQALLHRVYVSPLAVNDEAPSQTAAPLASIGNDGNAAGAGISGAGKVLLDSSSQCRTRAIYASTVFRLATLGWRDSRGRV